MVKISQARTPVGFIQGGVPLSRVNTNPDDDDDDDEEEEEEEDKTNLLCNAFKWYTVEYYTSALCWVLQCSLKLLLALFDEKFQLSVSALISGEKCKGQEHHHDFL